MKNPGVMGAKIVTFGTVIDFLILISSNLTIFRDCCVIHNLLLFLLFVKHSFKLF